jgi:hypothetical protein
MASVDQGIAVFFVAHLAKSTPASPQPNAANGGVPATGHGWYGGVTPERWIGLFEGGHDLEGFWLSSSLGGTASGVPASTLKVYQMMAWDSVTDAPYTWIATNEPDWAGDNYPGPNSPENICISERRRQ